MYRHQSYLHDRPVSGASLFSQLFKRLTLIVVILGLIVRCGMIAITGPAALDMTAMQYIGSFVIGLLNDIAFSCVASLPLLLYAVTIGEGKYRSPWRYIIIGALLCATIYLGWFCAPLQEFNRGLSKALRYILIYWVASYLLRLAFPHLRQWWTKFWLAVLLFLYITIYTMNACGELFFWNEFGVRYNFIAVDYLVYTSEVIGNIMESYPIIPLSLLLIFISGMATWLIFRRQIVRAGKSFYSSSWRWRTMSSMVVASVAAIFILSFTQRWQQSDNNYYNELQANGAYSFYNAFMKNELDYGRFYQTLPDAEAAELIKRSIGADTTDYCLQDSAARPINVVLVTMESMSASYLNHFGGTENLTPTLDSLYSKSLAFDKMYANGNRTVRGLEALSLSLPPAAGQSLIKRPDFKTDKSFGSILKQHGYRPMFFYGGKSYFDNMGPYFSNIGYEVIDIDNFKPEEIRFKNIWGVCDGDSYSRMLKELDAAYSANTPFFAQIMTISNHRPYTYPEGCIDIPADSKSRAGGVKYADYALGQFLKEAAGKPWFDNTIFVIISDHCASSAGETKLPPHNYHIPALIYSPKLVKPQVVDFTTSQIDIMPTILSLIGIDETISDYGVNILSKDYTPRAFLATYQDLGYLEGDTLTVLSPGKRMEQFKIVIDSDGNEMLQKLDNPSNSLIRKSIANYQTAAAIGELR